MQSCEPAWSLRSTRLQLSAMAFCSLPGMDRILVVYCIDTCTKVMDKCKSEAHSDQPESPGHCQRRQNAADAVDAARMRRVGIEAAWKNLEC